MRNRPLYDVVALLARCGVGAVFLAHGWQKIQVGVTATGHDFDKMGVPVPTAAAVYSTFVELLGGAALIVGIALPVIGVLLFLDMMGALVFVHAEHGIFLVDKGNVQNGFELVLLLGLAALLFGVGAAGRLTLDQRIFGGSADKDDDEDLRWPDGNTSLPGPSEEPPTVTEPRPARRPTTHLVTDTSRDVAVAGMKTPVDKSDDDTARKSRTGRKTGARNTSASKRKNDSGDAPKSPADS